MIRVILRNPLDKKDTVDYTIQPNDTLLAKDWTVALTDILKQNLHLEKNYCFMGFPDTVRNLDILCKEVNRHIERINKGKIGYRIEEYFVPEALMFDETYDEMVGTDDQLLMKHHAFNALHEHFEVLQGTVENISDYYHKADPIVKYSIRQLNNLCHEMENVCLSKIKKRRNPMWVRPSQITTFLNAKREFLKDVHRQGFLTNSYDRVFGGVYMHWCQIGKTYFEVWRDEDAPELTETVCSAITQLKYYSGEFDIEWARDVVYGGPQPWHDEDIDEFMEWCKMNGVDTNDPNNSLGYLPLGQVNLQQSFGTKQPEKIWEILGSHLDICAIESNGVITKYDYNWADIDFEVLQMKKLGLMQ